MKPKIYSLADRCCVVQGCVLAHARALVRACKEVRVFDIRFIFRKWRQMRIVVSGVLVEL
jgi:predicted hydrolase (HD superfamily)